MRTGLPVSVVVALAAWAFVLPASAQTVYRCGPDGRSYAQQPCDEGKPVRVGDARSEAQRREAELAAGREARVARSLERERLAARPAASVAMGIDGRGSRAAEPANATRPASKKRRKSSPNDAEFRAAVPRPAKTKTAATNG